MFLALEERLRESVASYVSAKYGSGAPVVVELPRRPEFGELALPLCFGLAKRLRREPRKIAEELAANLPAIAGIRSIEAAGGGYLNVRFDRGAYALAALSPAAAAADKAKIADKTKIIVEHTNINPNKAAHIGHLRNAVLGDTLVRMLRALGREVEAQNYIDNTGVQVADVAAAFHFLERRSRQAVAALAADPDIAFDRYCWDLYAAVSRRYAERPESLSWRTQALSAIESGTGELAALGRVVSDAIVDRHLDTMLRIGVEYDVLPRESEILGLEFWAAAFALLKQRKAVYLETAGKNAGCWVMPAENFRDAPAGARPDRERPPDEEAAASASKVIVRSNGTVTYVGKDIAYQLWKFGLLPGKDFHYAPLRRYPSGRQAWVSTADAGASAADAAAPAFGSGAEAYNVIDARQAYLQDVVRAALRLLGYERQAARSIHFSYEMVALSPRCCAELGIELAEEDRKRPYVEVSGRKGLGVKADDLIDRLIDTAYEEVRDRHEDLSEAACREIAEQIAVGALRYFMLRFTRTTVIAFDFAEALAFEGETGPYLQYAAVRAKNILRKFEETAGAPPDFSTALSPQAWSRHLDENLWQLLLTASRSRWAISRAAAGGEPAQLARHAFELARTFSNFYHQYPVLKEADRERQTVLLSIARYVLDELKSLLAVMGIPAPDAM